MLRTPLRGKASPQLSYAVSAGNTRFAACVVSLLCEAMLTTNAFCIAFINSIDGGSAYTGLESSIIRSLICPELRSLISFLTSL